MNARGYLETYFPEEDITEYENSEHAKFTLSVAKDQSAESIVLDYGCGPILLNTICFAGHASRIDYLDISYDCLRELEMWKHASPKAWNWDPYIKQYFNKDDIENSRKYLRSLMGRFYEAQTTMNFMDKQYDCLIATFSLDIAAMTLQEMKTRIDTCLKVLKPHGKFGFSFIEETDKWFVLEETERSVNVSMEDAKKIFSDYDCSIYRVPNSKHEGYKGFIFCYGRI